MPDTYSASFDLPDEVIDVGKVRSEIVRLNAMTLARETHAPGWRWSIDIKPLVGTEWCESRHVGVVLSGHLQIMLPDGTIIDLTAGDAIDIPPGHDGWVVGDEPGVILAWVGTTTWLSPLDTLKERILVTVVFTDIVDSTGDARRLGDMRWADLLAEHNRIVEDVADRFRGRVVKQTGDGALTIFDGAARAVRAALALSADLAVIGLRTRVGVHTGEIGLAGDDVQGIVVHEAARIMAHADPGEVLVSEQTRALARDQELAFEDRGNKRLKGLDEPIRLFAVSQAR